jgi:hypothetical protein
VGLDLSLAPLIHPPSIVFPNRFENGTDNYRVVRSANEASFTICRQKILRDKECECKSRHGEPMCVNRANFAACRLVSKLTQIAALSDYDHQSCVSWEVRRTHEVLDGTPPRMAQVSGGMCRRLSKYADARQNMLAAK